MKHFALVILAVVVLATGSAGATQYFQEATADANGDFLWSNPDNWGGTIPAGIGERAYFDAAETCVLYSTQFVGQLRLPSAGPSATLTMRAGADLTVGDALSQGPLNVGKGGDGTLNIEGGVLSVPSLYSHGGLMLGYTSSTTTATVNQSGGTVDAPGTIVLGRSNTAHGEYYLSGGTVNAGSVNITHGASLSSSVFEISGGVFNGTATGYASGINIRNGGRLSVVGGLATIDVAQYLWVGGWNNTDPGTFTLAYELDATGLTTINAGALNVQAGTGQVPNLELTAGPGAAPGTYTLIHADSDPTADLGSLNQTGDAGFSNLWVVDIAGDGTAGYDVTVDYIPEPATMLLLSIGGLGVLLRKRR